MQTVLVTGTSSGIGRASVEALAAAGCQVVATARRVADIQDLAGPNVDVARLDVTDEAQRRAAVEGALAQHGRIDALVNNAGHGAYLPVEETALDVYRSMLEVNVLGAHRLAQLVLPHMRERGSGRIVNVSSVAGHVAVPMIGAYSSTKHALRALSQVLAMEVRQFGIRVSLVEPGAVTTSFGQRAQSEREGVGPDRQGPYADLHAFWDRWMARRSRHGAGPEAIAALIVHACTARRPRLHYIRPFHGKVGHVAAHVLPDRVASAVLRRYFRL